MAGERARAALRRGLEARGYRLDPDAPALRVNVLPALADRSRSSGPQISLGLGLGFGGGRTRGGVGIGVPIGGGSREDGRLPPAVTVDVVDTRGNRVVWSGSVDLSRPARGEAPSAPLEAALARLLEQIPAR